MPAAAPRKEAFDDRNDWLNALVDHRVAEEQGEGASLSVEMAFVAKTRHQVYQRRAVPSQWAWLGAFLLLTAVDQIGTVYLVDRFLLR